MVISDGQRKVFISLVMLILLGLQAIATFGSLAGLKANRKFWPWTNYPMYEQKFSAGDRIPVAGTIYAVLESGDKVPVTIEGLGLGFWKHSYLFNRLSKNEEVLDTDLALVESVLPGGSSPVKAIETYSYPLIITREGPVEAEPEQLRRIEIE